MTYFYHPDRLSVKCMGFDHTKKEITFRSSLSSQILVSLVQNIYSSVKGVIFKLACVWVKFEFSCPLVKEGQGLVSSGV